MSHDLQRRSPDPHGAVDAAALARARWTLMGLFGLLGIVVSSWLSRLPSVCEQLGLDTGELGVVLLVGACGSLVTVTLAGPALARFGGLRTLHAATVGFVASFALLSAGVALGSLPLLATGIFLNGASFALNNVPLNVESAGIERRMGRTVIPQFHACFSIGALAGTLVGAACSWGGVSAAAQYAGSLVVILVWRLVAVPHVVLDTRLTPSGPTDAVERVGARLRLRSALSAWRERRTLMLGLVVMSAALSEGAANDWLAIAVVDGFGRTEAVGALVFGVFVGSMTVFRIAGTGLIDKHGRVRVLRWSGLVSIVGLALFGLAPGLEIAAVGVAMWGFGAALAIPIGIAAASDDPLRAAGRVSVVSAFSSMASLAAPPLLGLVAEVVGARSALTLIIVGLVVSVAVAGQAEREPVAHPAHPDRTATDDDGAAAPTQHHLEGVPA